MPAVLQNWGYIIHLQIQKSKILMKKLISKPLCLKPRAQE